MSLATDPQPTRLERMFLAVTVAFYALFIPAYYTLIRPGFSHYDEEGVLDQLQLWREGHPLPVGIGWCSVHKWMCAGLVTLGGPHLALVHLPTLMAVLLEAPLLYAWVRPKAGRRAALWAVLAHMVATVTFARGESILDCGMLPFFFLVGVMAVEGGLEALPSFGVGVYLAAMTLDYEGWAEALLFLVPYAIYLRRGRPKSLAAGLAGGLAGLGLALSFTHNFWAKVHGRAVASGPQLDLLGQIRSNVLDLILPTDRIPFADAPNHSWPSPWIWIPLAVGAVLAAKRHRWLLGLAVCGAAAVVAKGTAMEPQRLSLTYLAFSVMAGLGVARLWDGRWGRALCVGLLLFGVADEMWAWASIPASTTAILYRESVPWEDAADWLGRHQPPQGWRLITGLGGHADGAFRFLAAGAGVRPGGEVPVAFIHPAFRPAMRELAPAPHVRIGRYMPVVLWFPGPRDARRLEAIEASLEPLHVVQTTASVSDIVAAARAWLQAPGHDDIWGRTVAWCIWLRYSMLDGALEPAGVAGLLTDSLDSAQAANQFALVFRYAHPEESRCFSDKALDIDPALANLDLQERADLY